MNSQSSSKDHKNPENAWLDAWYGGARWTFWLLPAMCLFILLAGLRRFWIRRYLKKHLPTPVIVVGNITVGGTGKTPLIIAMVKRLQQQGYRPGVISRGYGGAAPVYPYLLGSTSTAKEAGDEPLTIFLQTNTPVAVGADRIAAGRLLEDEGCDILLSDDGLQHYRLGRDMEIAVVDGQRLLGNGWRLPVGPLRESASRLKTVDWVIVNSPAENFSFAEAKLDSLFYVPMQIQPMDLMALRTGNIVACNSIAQKVNAVAGIGNPQRFANTLLELGFNPALKSFPDHHAFMREDLDFDNELPVIMTEKDAVKCREFAKDNWFYLPITAVLPETFWNAFMQKVERAVAHKKSGFLL